MQASYEELAGRFQMCPHPEGGLYVETYRSTGIIDAKALPERWGSHCYSTGILFMLPKGQKSNLHRIRQDELWHFYLGGPLRLVMLFEDGSSKEVILGSNVLEGEEVQFAVPAGCWFGAKPCEGTEYSLVGCTVAPGFEFSDFELADRKSLLLDYPCQKDLILEFTLG